MRIVLTCGYYKSLHAVALIHQLAGRGYDVALCLQVQMLNWRRARSYLRQIGWRKMWQKVRIKLFSGADGSSAEGEVAPMLDYLRDHGISSRTVRQVCKKTRVRRTIVSSLNSPEAVEACRRVKPDLIVYAGGGVLRKDFIGIPRLGVLNAHGGPLPLFRGMNASEWALLHGVRPAVVIHYIDTGIDTGPIFFQKLIPDQDWKSVARGRGHATVVGVEGLLEAVNGLAEGRLASTPQPAEAGRQFFVMADPLLEVLEQWLRAGWTPRANPAEFSFPARRAAVASGMDPTKTK